MRHQGSWVREALPLWSPLRPDCPAMRGFLLLLWAALVGATKGEAAAEGSSAGPWARGVAGASPGWGDGGFRGECRRPGVAGGREPGAP